MKILVLLISMVLSVLLFTKCTYSINMAHTEGTASDVIDETATNTPSTTIKPTLSLPTSAL